MYEDSNKSLKFGASSIFLQVEKYYKGNWVIDVGSNTGMFIECVLDKYPKALVLGFEPVKRYWEFSRERLKLHSDNIILENCALSDIQEINEIHVAKNNIGWNTFIKEKIDEDNRDTKEMVSCIRFDDYYKTHRLDKVDIIKIDVEGFEFRVLNGMREFLKEQMPIIICEVGWGCEHPFWKEELDAFEYLYTIGYDISPQQRLEKLSRTTDVLFKPWGVE